MNDCYPDVWQIRLSPTQWPRLARALRRVAAKLLDCASRLHLEAEVRPFASMEMATRLYWHPEHRHAVLKLPEMEPLRNGLRLWVDVIDYEAWREQLSDPGPPRGLSDPGDPYVVKPIPEHLWRGRRRDDGRNNVAGGKDA